MLARAYGKELSPGQTFVGPHLRGYGGTRMYYRLGYRELRSSHAVADFERALSIDTLESAAAGSRQ
jgi:hypothetical protein